MCVENSAKRSDRRASLILVFRSSGNVCSVQKNQNKKFGRQRGAWCGWQYSLRRMKKSGACLGPI